MTYLSPLRSALVRSDARSEPEPGSENPWHQKMSALAVFGRKCCFCASLPNCAITGPTIVTLKPIGVGTLRLLHLVLVHVDLHRRPVLPAPLHRPVRRRPAARVQDALRRDHVVARQALAFRHLVADRLREFRCGRNGAPRRGRRVPRAVKFRSMALSFRNRGRCVVRSSGRRGRQSTKHAGSGLRPGTPPGGSASWTSAKGVALGTCASVVGREGGQGAKPCAKLLVSFIRLPCHSLALHWPNPTPSVILPAPKPTEATHS